VSLAALLLGLALIQQPAADFDKDGVPDLQDDCPTDPGSAAGNGCPAKAPPALPPPPATEPKPAPAPSKVKVAPDRLQLDEPVFFETGSARIQARSRGLLDEIAEAIRSLAPGTVVSVQGHTDNRGRRSSNLRLSFKRAESVVRHLVKRGVPAARLRSVGHGPDRPITSNDSAKGRAQNRRVELLILP